MPSSGAALPGSVPEPLRELLDPLVVYHGQRLLEVEALRAERERRIAEAREEFDKELERIREQYTGSINAVRDELRGIEKAMNPMLPEGKKLESKLKAHPAQAKKKGSGAHYAAPGTIARGLAVFRDHDEVTARSLGEAVGLHSATGGNVLNVLRAQEVVYKSRDAKTPGAPQPSAHYKLVRGVDLEETIAKFEAAAAAPTNGGKKKSGRREVSEATVERARALFHEGGQLTARQLGEALGLSRRAGQLALEGLGNEVEIARHEPATSAAGHRRQDVAVYQLATGGGSDGA